MAIDSHGLLGIDDHVTNSALGNMSTVHSTHTYPPIFPFNQLVNFVLLLIMQTGSETLDDSSPDGAISTVFSHMLRSNTKELPNPKL